MLTPEPDQEWPNRLPLVELCNSQQTLYLIFQIEQDGSVIPWRFDVNVVTDEEMFFKFFEKYHTLIKGAKIYTDEELRQVLLTMGVYFDDKFSGLETTHVSFALIESDTIDVTITTTCINNTSSIALGSRIEGKHYYRFTNLIEGINLYYALMIRIRDRKN